MASRRPISYDQAVPCLQPSKLYLCTIYTHLPDILLHETTAIAAASTRCTLSNTKRTTIHPRAIRRRHSPRAMAYDTYRSQPDAHQASYPSSYDYNHAPSSYDSDSQYHVFGNGRSRASSSVASNDGAPQPAQQPLKTAIGNAFEKSDAARVVDPDLMAQITEQVKKAVLEEIKASVTASVTQSQPVPVPQEYAPLSPASTSASVPPRDVYTPPSPKRADFSSQPSTSPDPFTRDPLLDGSSDTPTPRHGRSAPVDNPIERPSVRPAPAARMATDDYTPIEKMWQRLFEPDGQPLPRLGQFLRGLALHLVCTASSRTFIMTKFARSKTMSPREAWSFHLPRCFGSTKK